MGLLAESKSRRKISKDPNNTKWTRDTSTFGQKILRAQGWEPGQYLGAKDAGHSNLHTAANASYIRVSLKDDMKGLGFGRGKEDEVTGLNVFSDLLSRLNGKSEEDVEGDRRARLVMKTNVYVEQRWGPMRFVKGGLLVGENVEERNASDESSAAPEMDEMRKSKDEPSMKESKSKSKSKKRKLEDIEDKDAEADAKKEKKRRKEERRARKAAARSALGETEDAHHSTDAKPRKKSTKNKPLPSDDMGTEYADDGSRRRARKAKSKDKRPVAEEAAKAGSASKKDKREKSRSEKTDIDAAAASSSEPEDDGGPALTTGTSTPTGSGTGTSTPRGGRNFVRSRFIAAKRQAMLDAKSLNQIFMIKT